jgi:septum formation protein
MQARLILASGSPRRREVLQQAGFSFEVVPAEAVEENYTGSESPAAYAERMAHLKAEDVARRYRAGEPVVVLGADTIVVLDKILLGKPASPAEAISMLEQLSGRTHEVITGVVLAGPGTGRRSIAHEVTQVYFRPLSQEEIRDYVATGEPLDKAGAYAVQGRAGRFVTRIEGCYFNVVGLPLALVDRLLREWFEGRR